uniref:Uncharacterized protein n=1 Tax=Cannabis sativa TaxID=3483 RepID=A0A803R7D6_CANSA
MTSSNCLEQRVPIHQQYKDFYNFLLDSGMDSISSSSTTVLQLSKESAYKRYSRYLSVLRSSYIAFIIYF